MPVASVVAWPLSRIRRLVAGSSARPPTAPWMRVSGSPVSGCAAMCTVLASGVVTKPGSP